MSQTAKPIIEFYSSNEMVRLGWVSKTPQPIRLWLDDRNIQAVVVESDEVCLFIFDIPYMLYRHAHVNLNARVVLFKPNCHGQVKKSIYCHGDDLFPIFSMHDSNKMVDQILNDLYIPSQEDLQLLFENDLFFTLQEWEVFFSDEF
eukprot:NODE_277_length_11973_cov_0.221895.p7 type:complete len:146 gc:universal NODE_277_length_11973_cov_0.221895:4687-5124(+)